MNRPVKSPAAVPNLPKIPPVAPAASPAPSNFLVVSPNCLARPSNPLAAAVLALVSCPKLPNRRCNSSIGFYTLK